MDERRAHDPGGEMLLSADDEVELWAEDEHRLGLKPVGRRPLGATRPTPDRAGPAALPVAPGRGLRLPEVGATTFRLVPAPTAADIDLLLQAFAEGRGVSARKWILLVPGQPRWHIRAQIQVPERPSPIPLPSYSPESQPAEHLRSLIDDALARQGPRPGRAGIRPRSPPHRGAEPEPGATPFDHPVAPVARSPS